MQDKKTKSIPVFPEIATALQLLPKEKIGEFMYKYFDYGFNGVQPDFKNDIALRCLWSIAQPQIDRVDKKYKETCIKNAYSRYLGDCKNKNIEPLSPKEWAESKGCYYPL